MKIMNNTYRDVRENESTIEKTPVSDLSETTELPVGSIIHVVTKDINGNYESKKMTTDWFKQKIYDSVQNTFKTSYWDTHESGSNKHDQEEAIAFERPKGTSFKALLKYLKDKDANKSSDDPATYAPVEVPETDPNGFVDHIYYDFDLLKRYMVVKDDEIEDDIYDLNVRVNELDCYFAPSMKWVTTTETSDREIEVINNETVNANNTDGENPDYCQMRIESGNKISNEWVCPASGNLVIYGWLDSSECLNNKAVPGAFCVIEGNINNNWEVISACSVIPEKTMTYVGFNLMVKKYLTIRARTGFVCGVKSGQFANQQDGYDTLANKTPNGFMCKIYCSTDYDEGELGS